MCSFTLQKFVRRAGGGGEDSSAQPASGGSDDVIVDDLKAAMSVLDSVWRRLLTVSDGFRQLLESDHPSEEMMGWFQV